ncbi:MAG: DUF502 domain-containing protein [Flavobacteriales bacterium]|nr:DUF502 domain-containing protein [Flavobacteriales bacterium]
MPTIPEPEKNRKAFRRRFVLYFVKGLLLVVPTFVLVYVVYALFGFLDGIIPTSIPGLGLLILLGAITLLGFLGTNFITQPIARRANALLDKVPLVKTFYTAVSDLLGAFTGQNKSFSHPVMVRLTPDGHVQKPGFITSDDLSALGLGNDMVAVYMPHSYNFSGNIFIVPATAVTPIKINKAEFMKFIVSGGVTDLGKKPVDDHLVEADGHKAE